MTCCTNWTSTAFRIRSTGPMIKPRSRRPPIIIATSNEERRLPDAFLRRCIFHRIELTPALVEAAVESMARADSDDSGPAFPNLDAAARAAARKRFWELRELPGIEKKPSTAELLTWLCISAPSAWTPRP